MRLKLFIFLLACCAGVTPGLADDASNAHKDQLQAATSSAVEALGKSISLERITPELTVEEFLEKTRSSDRLAESLRRAQQIGGPRWVGTTCQVRLEISGARARAALVQIAAAQGKKSPLDADVLALRLKDWDKRTFAATGSSTSASDLESAKPDPANDAWLNVDDRTRKAALQAAKSDAIKRALVGISDIELPTKRRIGDVMQDKAVGAEISAWLESRPVTQVEFLPDRQVHVAMSIAPEELTERLRKAAGGSTDDAQWAAIGDALKRKLHDAVQGSAEITDNPVASAPAVVQLPALPPVWANEERQAEGSAPAGDSKLKSARAAEADAVGKLSKQIKELPLDGKITLGQAAERDPHVQAALQRAISHARTFKVDYQSDGGAQVKMAINLGDVWQELQPPN